MKKPSHVKRRVASFFRTPSWVKKLKLRFLGVSAEHNQYYTQLEQLTKELSRELEEEVIFRFGKNKIYARVKTKAHIIAELQKRPKGFNGSPYSIVYVRLNPDFTVLRSWFQMAFMGSRLAFTELPPERKILLLEHKPSANVPRER